MPPGHRLDSAGVRRGRRRRTASRIKRFGAPILAVCVTAIAATLRIRNSTDLSSALPLSDLGAAPVVSNPPGGVPVHLDSLPSGADIVVDGARRGRTPLDASLVPRQHTVTLRHVDSLDDKLTLEVPDTGASVLVKLWRQRPGVFPLGGV
jgi:PEGA domain